MLDLVDHDDKFIAAGSADHAAHADRVAEPQREFAQEAIARRVRHRIVDGFEAVHVDEEDADLMCRSRRAFDRRDQARARERAIGELRECVVLRQMP